MCTALVSCYEEKVGNECSWRHLHWRILWVNFQLLAAFTPHANAVPNAVFSRSLPRSLALSSVLKFSSPHLFWAFASIAYVCLLPRQQWYTCPGPAVTSDPLNGFRTPLPFAGGFGSRDSTFLSAKHSFSTQEFNRQSFRIKCAPTPPLGRCGVTHR